LIREAEDGLKKYKQDHRCARLALRVWEGVRNWRFAVCGQLRDNKSAYSLLVLNNAVEMVI
jgi:hypothetical protein